MIDFLLGTAVLVLPQGNLPLLAGIGAVKGAGEGARLGAAAADAAAASRSGGMAPCSKLMQCAAQLVQPLSVSVY